jgi:hypothetical protein
MGVKQSFSLINSIILLSGVHSSFVVSKVSPGISAGGKTCAWMTVTEKEKYKARRRLIDVGFIAPEIK